MSVLTLHFPVHTLDGKEILPAGTSLTGGVLEEVSARGKKVRFPVLPAMGFGTVRKDLLALTGKGVYRAFFGGEEEYAGLLRLLEMARLPLPVLDSLDYYKRRDLYTYRHILMVFALSSRLARKLLDRFKEILLETTAGPLHDFGKICVPRRSSGKKRT